MNTLTQHVVLDNLQDLLQAIDSLPTRIDHVTSSSKEACVGALFIAYPGAANDGRRFIGEALLRGASAVIYEAGDSQFEWDETYKVPSIAVVGLKQYASAIGAHVYQHPSKELWMIGVTGTNGKTSVSQWVAHALQINGQTAAVMGTIGNGIVEKLKDSENTTADALVLQRTLREIVDAKATACAMEVSSHGLRQGRVAAVNFDVAIFTNLTRDHLDYHGTMEQYAEAKAILFTLRGLKTAVINVDDAFGREVASRTARRGVDVIRYATNGGAKFANLIACNIAVSSSGLTFIVRWSNGAQTEEAEVETEILGAFNTSNLLAVIGALLASGVQLSRAAEIVRHLKPVRGRMQTVRTTGSGASKPLVIVDYAHTPDALEKALSTISAVVPDKGRLISVFGCGGDRDRGKRSQMGAISARYADYTILTSDNPRNEDPLQILNDIEAGIGQTPHRLIDDRQQAIFEALNIATVDDVILIAGKGHENYQIIGSRKQHFCDVEVALEALSLWSGIELQDGRMR